MSRYLAAIAAPLVAFVTYAVQAQEHPPSTLPRPEDTSFYLGQTVLHPEALSGLWEVSDGHGGAIGIHLQLDTSVPADATSLNGVPQSWQDSQVGVYYRRGPAIQRGVRRRQPDRLPALLHPRGLRRRLPRLPHGRVGQLEAELSRAVPDPAPPDDHLDVDGRGLGTGDHPGQRG